MPGNEYQDIISAEQVILLNMLHTAVHVIIVFVSVQKITLILIENLQKNSA